MTFDDDYHGTLYGPFRKPRRLTLLQRFHRWLAFVFLGVR